MEEMVVDLTQLPRRKVLWLLFYNFFKIALFVVGGGYAIILAAENIFIRKLRWLKDGELMDMLAVIQTIPGLLAGNAAIYVGYRAAGRMGAFVALLGVALPSFIIITLVAMGFSQLPMDNSYVQGAFIGVRSALAGLTLAALCRTWRKIMLSPFAYAVALGCFGGVVFFNINPAWLLLGAMMAGVVYFKAVGAKISKANLTVEGKQP